MLFTFLSSFLIALCKAICRSRLSPSFLSPLTCWQQLNFIYLPSVFTFIRRNKKSIDKHARKWCRRAASSPCRHLPLSLHHCLFGVLTFHVIRRKTTSRLTNSTSSSSVNKYWTKIGKHACISVSNGWGAAREDSLVNDWTKEREQVQEKSAFSLVPRRQAARSIDRSTSVIILLSIEWNFFFLPSSSSWSSSCLSVAIFPWIIERHTYVEHWERENGNEASPPPVLSTIIAHWLVSSRGGTHIHTRTYKQSVRYVCVMRTALKEPIRKRAPVGEKRKNTSTNKKWENISRARTREREREKGRRGKGKRERERENERKGEKRSEDDTPTSQ